jgi:Fe-S oxidoreductase
VGDAFTPVADSLICSTRGQHLILVLHILGLICFGWIISRRLRPLLAAQSDPRFDRPLKRLRLVLQFWLGQWRHPRYPFAGVLHLILFGGFLLLAGRAFSVLALGVAGGFGPPENGWLETLRDFASTAVFGCMIVAIVRRLWFRPARYPRSADAIFLLALIAILMAADGVFAASRAAYEARVTGLGDALAALTLSQLLARAFAGLSVPTLHNVYLGAYLTHEAAFFFLLCYRPFGIQFHVETSLFSIYFGRLERGTVKPARWNVPDEELDKLDSIGVKRFEDFTWKHVLDFYSCADCGRCAEQCPAASVGRALAPRTLSVRARDYVFRRYPVFGAGVDGQRLVGDVFAEDEIWSCTTCGACEQECPLLVEYIDKIVDLRRGLVDDGKTPQSLHKPLQSLTARGNPFGKPERKRGDWAKDVASMVNGHPVDLLYFVDSVTSYDDRVQSVGRATARILSRLREDFGILGPRERDSGHEVRRFGEETLFLALREHNREAIHRSGATRVITADPHAYNALKHDYGGAIPVEHISQRIARAVRTGQLRLNAADGETYTYHDPCYLGRHNAVYEDPRDVLDSIPGLKRVEMKRSRDRSFCCGGGGLSLFYEAKEQERMAVRRVRMAAEAGASVIVTACPFCLLNDEDAIKVAGFEGKMSATDLAELVDRQAAG